MLWFLLALLLSAALTVALATLHMKGVVRFNYPSTSRYPVRGIDISHHQGAIDWQRLAQRPPNFVFMKASEGAQFVDPRFPASWRAAETHRIPRGAYHYFNFCTPGHLQAANLISVLPPGQRMLPPAIDIEFTGNCKALPDPETIRAELAAMLAGIERAYGRQPLLYVTQDAYERLILGHFPGYPLWVRNIFRRPRLSDGRSWVFWQFADRGRLAGIDGPVDLNVFSGSMSELLAIEN
jgi:lysozyme